MPVSVKFDDLRDPTYRNALRKLGNCMCFESTKVAYDVGRLVKAILKDEFQTMVELEEQLVKKYAELDDKGNLALFDTENGQKQYKILDGKEEEFAAARKEFYSTVVTVEKNPIALRHVEEAGLSPMELVALEPLLTDVDLRIVENPVTLEK